MCISEMIERVQTVRKMLLGPLAHVQKKRRSKEKKSNLTLFRVRVLSEKQTGLTVPTEGRSEMAA